MEMRMERGYPEPVGDEDEIRFFILLDTGKVTNKYLGVEYRDEESKTRLHSTPCHAYMKHDYLK